MESVTVNRNSTGLCLVSALLNLNLPYYLPWSPLELHWGTPFLKEAFVESVPGYNLPATIKCIRCNDLYNGIIASEVELIKSKDNYILHFLPRGGLLDRRMKPTETNFITFTRILLFNLVRLDTPQPASVVFLILSFNTYIHLNLNK